MLLGTNSLIYARRSGVDPTLVLDLIGTTERFTDVAATVPASTGDAVAAWRSSVATPILGTQGTLAQRPLADANGLVFDSDDQFLMDATGQGLLRNNSAVTVYAVIRPTVVSGAAREFVYWSRGADVVTRFAIRLRNGNWEALGRRLDTDGETAFSMGAASIGTLVVVAASVNWVTREWRWYVNAVLTNSNNTFGTGGGPTSDTASQQARVTWTGDIRRIRAYHAAHDAARVLSETQVLAAAHGVSL